MDTVYVVHCGEHEDEEMINYLNKTFKQSSRYRLEYIEYREHQQKETLLYLALKKNAEEKIPIIVLITEAIFQLVWPTPYKSSVLKLITNYPERKCVHIWSREVTEKLIKRYSTYLLAQSPTFRKMDFQELTSLKDPDAIQEIISKLFEPGSDRLAANNNLSVQNFPDLAQVRSKPLSASASLDYPVSKSNQVKYLNVPSKAEQKTRHVSKSFKSLEHSTGSQVLVNNARTTGQRPAAVLTQAKPPSPVMASCGNDKSTRKKKQRGAGASQHVKDVASWMTIPGVEEKHQVPSWATESGREGVVRDGAVREGEKSKAKRKKNKNKKGGKKLRELDPEESSALVNRFSGKNLKRLAEAFQCNSTECSTMETLLHKLQTQLPAVSVQDLVQKCKQAEHPDIAELLEQDFLL